MASYLKRMKIAFIYKFFLEKVYFSDWLHVSQSERCKDIEKHSKALYCYGENGQGCR